MNLGELLGDRNTRRQRLDGAIDRTLRHYLGPTGIPDKVASLNQLINPVEHIEQAGRSAQTMMDPNASGWDRLGAGANMAADVASVVAPGAAIGRAGAPAAAAVTESLLGIGAPARQVVGDSARRFATEEAGTVGRGTPAEDVARLLREGRGDEVTDEMMARVDPQEMWRLYESGATGVPMPMDEASRMARARDMGFDTGTPLYHGTGASFDAFDANKIGAREVGWYGDGIYSTAMPDLAGEYMSSARFDAGTQGNIMPLSVRRGQEYVWAGNPAATTRAEAKEFRQNLGSLGYDTVRVPNDYGGDLLSPVEAANYEVVTFDPRNIRSRFARFDPRLAHLANLSAGVGGAVPLSAILSQQDDPETQQRKLREYLERVE
jgi:hypothetical protein